MTRKKADPTSSLGRPASRNSDDGRSFGGRAWQDLRKQAEKSIREKGVPAQRRSLDASLGTEFQGFPEEIQRMLHELRVHQIELELQNEELRRAQEALEVLKARYFDLYDLAPVGYVVLSEQSLILEANLTAAALLGEERGALIKKPITRFILPEDQDIYYRHRKSLFEKGEPQTCELRMVRKDGSCFWARVEASTAQAADCVSSVCRAVISDISEVKEGEEQLRHSEAFLGSVIDHSPIAMWVSDDKGTLIRLNEACRLLLRITEDEVLGKYNVLRDDIVERQGFMPLVRSVFERGETARFILEYHTPDLRQLPLRRDVSVVLDVTISPVKDGRGRVTNAVVQHVDITERHKAEEAVLASLREKEVMLREIHHRVKNNMQVISSLFNLQIGHTLNQECRDILKEGQTRIRAMSLVHEKLYQSHDLSKIDLAAYIQSLAVHLFHVYLIDPEQVRLETDFGEVALDINSAVPCGLILNELISNSLKHAFPESRKGLIRIGLKRGADDKIALRVADDGVGFPKDVDFRQAESFGLQIVNLLVGQLEAVFELDRGAGTAFSVTFREAIYAPRM